MTHPAARLFAILTLLLPALPLRAADVQSTLVEGVKEIAVPGSPGPVCAFGDAVVVVTSAGKAAAPVAAASALDRGRLVALGHNGYFDAEALGTADTARFVANCAAWAAGGSGRPGPHVVGLRGCKTAETALAAAGIKCVSIDGGTLAPQLPNVDAIVCPAGEIKAGDLPALEAFVRRGGGVVTGVPGWGFLQTHAGATLNDLPANRLVAKAGIVWADGSVDRPANNRFAVGGAVSPLFNANAALAAVVAETPARPLAKADAELAATTLSRAAQAVPAGDTLLLPQLEKLTAAARGTALVGDKGDLLAGNNSLARVALTFDVTRERSLPADQVKAHPLSKTFPGEVPAGAPRVTKGVTVDLSIPDWHSTGCYAAAGEVVTVAVPADAPAGLKVRIGSHSDKLWNLAGWQRVPEIDRVFPLKAGENRVASAFGGLVYVVVPAKAQGSLSVRIAGVVEAPLFEPGKTDAGEWRRRIRLAPGPWAEVASGKVIFTLPSKYVRELNDPAALMAWWDRALDGAADLYQIPRERPRPERYVADVQISAGYMHSGYPIMTHLDAAPRMVDLPTLSTKGEWGLFHELGHNHQRPEWTFTGTGEVTNNLLPLYLLETLCNKAPLHASFTAAARAKAEAKYEKGGADFEVWQKEPFTALIMYQQLRDGFGWETFKKVFAEYRDLPADQKPKSDLEKHDQWMVRFSRTCGRNLGPFFQYWGVPTSEGARKSVEGLAEWKWR